MKPTKQVYDHGRESPPGSHQSSGPPVCPFWFRGFGTTVLPNTLMDPIGPESGGVRTLTWNDPNFSICVRFTIFGSHSQLICESADVSR